MNIVCSEKGRELHLAETQSNVGEKGSARF